MQANNITLSIPASYEYARTVRMMASNLAVLCKMSVDDIEDVRMAAEEGFVYCCATNPPTCHVSFSMDDHSFSMDFVLGADEFSTKSEADQGLVNLMLQAVCDEFDVREHSCLHLSKFFDEVHDNTCDSK